MAQKGLKPFEPTFSWMFLMRSNPRNEMASDSERVRLSHNAFRSPEQEKQNNNIVNQFGVLVSSYCVFALPEHGGPLKNNNLLIFSPVT